MTLKLIKPNWAITFTLCLGMVISTNAQDATIPLWEKNIPNEIKAKGYEEEKTMKDGGLQSVTKVTNPTLSVYLPKNVKPNGTAILILPGGGYGHVAMLKEGKKVAEWLNTLGITAFVLKYRLPNDTINTNKSIAPLQDAQEAMRIIRRNTTKWNIKDGNIGVMGFSAGGHLASTLSTHYDEKVYESGNNPSARPDFSMLIYPVISMKNEITHKGSQANLLGNTPSEKETERFSNELQVTDKTPIAFIVHATDDKVVLVENSIRYYQALKQHNVSAELHIYEKGGHGFGLAVKPGSTQWTAECTNWLRENGYL